MTYFKVLTHDFRPPVQGGEPIFDGRTPCTLPVVPLDTSEAECARGWNFSDSLAGAFKIAGLWPDGRPSTAWLVEPSADAIQRGNKHRASGLTIQRACTEAEIRSALAEIAAPLGDIAADLTEEQVLWREALARPQHDPVAVEAALTVAVKARGLKWKLKRYEYDKDTWLARAATATRHAWTGEAAWNARAVWWAAGDTWAAWDAGDAWDAWDARDAILVWIVARKGWTQQVPELLTLGLQDAYRHGLGLALPVELGVLGWAMDEQQT